MKHTLFPYDQLFWSLKNDGAIKTARKNQHADVVIVGGGVAGLSAAHAFCKRGKKVILLEQYYCGSGASGKSSGFVTPNAELSFNDFSKRYNVKDAQTIWDFIRSGVQDMRTIIRENTLMCDYNEQDTLIVANSPKDFTVLEAEYNALLAHGYKTELYNEQAIRHHIGSDHYYGGMLYKDSFSFNSYAYCQQMKKHLESLGVLIFEETPVTSLQDHAALTPHATITADYSVVCVDRFFPDLELLKQDVYHAQTFIMVSQQLTEDQIRLIFPQKNMLVWDTALIYNYFRITPDNRLLIGGGDLISTYATHESHNYKPIVTQLSAYLAKRFPMLKVHFNYMWPGLIGLSKDIGPIAGPSKDNKHIYYIAAAAGLPIAAALGRYSAQHLLEGDRTLDAFFSPYRKFPIGGLVQSIIGTKLSFALSNFLKHNVP